MTFSRKTKKVKQILYTVLEEFYSSSYYQRNSTQERLQLIDDPERMLMAGYSIVKRRKPSSTRKT